VRREHRLSDYVAAPHSKTMAVEIRGWRYDKITNGADKSASMYACACSQVTDGTSIADSHATGRRIKINSVAFRRLISALDQSTRDDDYLTRLAL